MCIGRLNNCEADMSRAGILYGVTMGSDAVSKLLSVKFEEAVAIAK